MGVRCIYHRGEGECLLRLEVWAEDEHLEGVSYQLPENVVHIGRQVVRLETLEETRKPGYGKPHEVLVP